jgi:HK97 family phage prohead protease
MSTDPISPLDEYAREQVQGLQQLGRVPTREFAMQVPAVLRGRNLLCSLSTLPIIQIDSGFNRVSHPLLEQINPNVPNVVTVSQTIEDLLFDAISWWRVTKRGWDDFPVNAEHLDVTAVTLDPPEGWQNRALPSGIDPESVIWVEGEPVNGRDMIRFDSPNPGILRAARRALRRAAKLDQAAERYADDPKPQDYFTPTDGIDPGDDDEVEKLLNAWAEARRRRASAYVPGAFQYHEVNWLSPADLQLVSLQQRVALDVANALGLDPEDLGISTTSRTYQNATDRRRDRINDVLRVYMVAISGRLSMNDVTKRGYSVRFDLTEYLRTDPKTMAEVEKLHLDMGTLAPSEIRAEQERPPITAAQKNEIKSAKPAPPAPAPATDDENQDAPQDAAQGGNVTRLRALDARFSSELGRDEIRISFASPTLDGADLTRFAVDSERRTVVGTAIPYGVWADNGWAKWKFLPGSMNWSSPSRVKFLLEHDPRDTLGVATELTDHDDHLEAKFRVGKGAKRDEALQDAADGIIDGLSVGLRINPSAVEWDKIEEGYVVSQATVREISLCSIPAFDDARLTSVAASSTGGLNMNCPLCGGEHAAGLPCSGAPLVTQSAPPSPPAPPAPAPAPAIDMTAFAQAFATAMGPVTTRLDAVTAALSAMQPAPEGPAFVNPRAGGPIGGSGGHRMQVTEPLPYRFGRTAKGVAFGAGDNVFSQDLLHMAQAGDQTGSGTDAGRRVMALLAQTFGEGINETFATVSTTDVDELNPTINQPSKYVDQADYRYPLWEFINDGGLPNGVQPFSFPKFASASGLVGDHTQGTEPVGGTFVTTSQTITPTAVSGKASITRETWEMGGNPQTSTLIWRQMVRSWREALENASATFLNTLTAATDILLTTAAVDDALSDLWEAAVADLQFIRFYDFRAFAIEKVLYKTFVSARAGGSGENLYPILNPSNRNGQASTRFRQLDLAGVVGTPAWALPSTGGAPNNSWLFDPMFVHGWASNPTRLEFPGTNASAAYAPVAMVDVAIWGYKAFANSDIAAVRQVIYDNA